MAFKHIFCEACTLNSRNCTAPGFEITPTEVGNTAIFDLSPDRGQYTTCIHYTCGIGQGSAIEAIHSAQLNQNIPVNVLIREQQYSGFPFGTNQKPVTLGRLITLQGEIITRDSQGKFYLSPQRIPAKFLK